MRRVSDIMSGVNLLSFWACKSNSLRRGTKESLFAAGFLSCLILLGCRHPSPISQNGTSLLPGPKPADATLQDKQLVGIYSDEKTDRKYVVLEQAGKLYWRDERGQTKPLSVLGNDVFPPSEGTSIVGHSIGRDKAGNALSFCYLNFCYLRTDPGAQREDSEEKHKPLAVERLRSKAFAAQPPVEERTFRPPDLLELASLDPAIHLDIRYATSNDFLGAPLYTQARAFLQRPAAEALLRVLHKLQPLGYGLLIYDGYRPWYVTKIFWDATPQEGKIFVADPAQGSRHNRGCAVDLTLYDLKTGEPIEMTGGYDEMSLRSFPNYPGGTSLQRWNRDLLRRAMESEGFTVYESEWWHFDYKDWHEYGILNVPFEKLGIGSATK